MTRSRAASILTSLSTRVLLALILGLLAGIAAEAWGVPGGQGTLDAIDAVGQLWLNALRMTIIPLVFALLVTGIASLADAAATGRLALRAIVVFALLLVGATVYGVVASMGLHVLWPIDPEGGRALIAGAPAGAGAEVAAGAKSGGFGAFVSGLAPANVVQAAAENAILSMVVFAVAFGFATTRLPARLREPIATFFEAVAQAMIVIVEWVLWAAPIGVFALAMGVGEKAGIGVAGVLAHYVAIVSLAIIGLILLVWVVGSIWGRMSPLAYLRAAAPALVVAVSTQSSLATLPTMIDRALETMGVSKATAGLVLPLAVAVFRITSPVANLAVCIYVAHLYGVPLSLPALVAGGAAAVAVSVGTVGLPGQVSFFASIAPICLAMGLPLEVLPLLLAVEIVPDIFRTVGNVAADMAVARIVEPGGTPEEANGETPSA